MLLAIICRKEQTMSVPRYEARRVGDEYVLVRVDPPGQALRAVATVAGVWLAGSGLMRRGTCGAVMAAVGAVLAYGGITGRNLLDALRPADRPRHGRPEAAPSGRATPAAADAPVQLPADAVEEASMASFPASDPPALSGRR
jgi:hypothetical protein